MIDASLEPLSVQLLAPAFDWTRRSKLSVAPPIGIWCYRAGSLSAAVRVDIRDGDPYLAALREQFGAGNARAVPTPPGPGVGAGGERCRSGVTGPGRAVWQAEVGLQACEGIRCLHEARPRVCAAAVPGSQRPTTEVGPERHGSRTRISGLAPPVADP